MIQLDFRSRSLIFYPTPTPSVLRNPTQTPPINLRFLATSAPQPWWKQLQTLWVMLSGGLTVGGTRGKTKNRGPLMTSSYSANRHKIFWSSLGRGHADHPRIRSWDYGNDRHNRKCKSIRDTQLQSTEDNAWRWNTGRCALMFFSLKKREIMVLPYIKRCVT